MSPYICSALKFTESHLFILSRPNKVQQPSKSAVTWLLKAHKEKVPELKHEGHCKQNQFDTAEIQMPAKHQQTLPAECIITDAQTILRLPNRLQDLDIAQLLMVIHHYFMSLGVDEIRRRGAQDEKSLRMVKSILHEITKLLVSKGASPVLTRLISSALPICPFQADSQGTIFLLPQV